MDRVYPFPKSARHFHCFTLDTSIKQHPAYRQGKAGDADSAFQVIDDLAFDFLLNLQGQFPPGCLYVAPYAQEATGDNALPLMLSLTCAEILEGTSEDDIVQKERVFHTGADPMERMIARSSFEGQVQPGQNYVLVDDVTNMGGTLAELANYIQISGGNVLGTIVLVNAGRSKEFLAPKKHLRLLEDRYSDSIQKLFGIHISAFTANEASYLVGFRTLNEIRNRCAKAEKETINRLLSKGHQRPGGSA